MRNLHLTDGQLAEHEARMARYRAEGRVRTVVDGRNERPKPQRAPQPKNTESVLERAMAHQIKEAGIPAPVREYLPFAERKFRLDFAWPEKKVAFECDGHVHRIKERFNSDIERHNLLLLAGWKIVRGGRAHIMDGRALAWLKEALA